MLALRNELIATMKEFCTELGISTPSVMTSRRRGGCYYVAKQTINLGQINLKDADMFKQVFVHELAHHVDHQVNAQVWEDRKWRRIARSSRTSHDRTFYKLLLTVIDKFYGDRSAYPWRWEYRTITAWARYAGISDQTKASKLDPSLVSSMLGLSSAVAADIRMAVAAERGSA